MPLSPFWQSVLSAALNFISSVGIIVTNRWIFQFYNFNFGVMLSMVHLMVTAASLRVFSKMGVFERSTSPALRSWTSGELIVLSCIHGLSVPFSNLTLQLCSVGFYQIMKIAMTPCIVLTSWGFFGGECPSFSITITLLVILVGAGITTSAEVSASPMGVLSAMMMSSTSAVCQVWMNAFQAKHKVSAVQLLMELAPYSAAICGVCGVLMEDVSDIINFDYSWNLEVALFISCSLALLYNVSFFVLVGATSALTYQVLGHLKTGLVILLGFVIFNNPVTSNRMMGIAVTFCGVVAYSYYKQKELPPAPSKEIEVVVDRKDEAKA